jgi:hypothetical protein
VRNPERVVVFRGQNRVAGRSLQSTLGQSCACRLVGSVDVSLGFGHGRRALTLAADGRMLEVSLKSVDDRPVNPPGVPDGFVPAGTLRSTPHLASIPGQNAAEVFASPVPG